MILKNDQWEFKQFRQNMGDYEVFKKKCKMRYEWRKKHDSILDKLNKGKIYREMDSINIVYIQT